MHEGVPAEIRDCLTAQEIQVIRELRRRAFQTLTVKIHEGRIVDVEVKEKVPLVKD